MPLFGKKKDKTLVENQQTARSPPEPNEQRPSYQTSTTQPESNGTPTPPPRPQPAEPPRPKLVFHCQQAHGSPTGIISGFTNVKELYQKIADAYDINVSEILFCTLNTHKIDMSKLLGGQIGLDDFIFAHIKGRPKELDVTKSEDALGLTITDNGAGYAFIKRIKEGSIMDRVPLIAVGDHIEKINGKNLIGCRHFEVAKMLKEIPKGTTFTIRTVEPMKSGFSNIGPPVGKKGSSKYGSGKETLRIRSSGPATVGISDDVVNIAVDKINGLLESFMGINDSELATTIWEMGSTAENPHEFTEKVDNSDIKDFGFTDDFMYDLWGAITDAKQGRLAKTTEFEEQF